MKETERTPIILWNSGEHHVLYLTPLACRTRSSFTCSDTFMFPLLCFLVPESEPRLLFLPLCTNGQTHLASITCTLEKSSKSCLRWLGQVVYLTSCKSTTGRKSWLWSVRTLSSKNVGIIVFTENLLILGIWKTFFRLITVQGTIELVWGTRTELQALWVVSRLCTEDTARFNWPLHRARRLCSSYVHNSCTAN